MRYLDLSQIYEKLEGTSKRLEKTYYISQLLKKTKEDDIHHIVLLLQGKLYPDWDETKIGMANRMVLKAINVATGIHVDKIEDEWKRIGDLGLVAEKLVGKKTQITLFSRDLTVEKVYNNLRKLASLEGAGSVDQKIKLVAELLSSAKPLEARYIIRTVLEDLRVGVGSGSLRDAIAWAYLPVKCTYNEQTKSIDVEDRTNYNETIEKIQSAYDKCNDFGLVAKAAMKGAKALENIGLETGNPIKVMLALKAKDVEDAFERVGKPADIEYKLDGFRMQVHKDGKKISIFTRRLEDVTKQFPEVVKYVEENVESKSFILDCEAVGFNPKTDRYMPFQHISQRIKRKYDIADLSKKLPVELNVFDIVYFEGQNMLNAPLKERRKLIEKIVKNKKRKIVVIPNIVTSSVKDAEKFYKESLKKGNEGVMFKNLESPYKPGARVGHMIKLKPIMETLDLVIVGAEWGTGKRAGWLTSYILACIDENDNFLEIGKVGTGFKEKEEEGVSFKEMTERLKPLIIVEKGREVKVKPNLVIEVKYEEIQKSPTYSSGFALRFQRLVKIRDDKGVDEISRIELVKELFEGQKK